MIVNSSLPNFDKFFCQKMLNWVLKMQDVSPRDIAEVSFHKRPKGGDGFYVSGMGQKKIRISVGGIANLCVPDSAPVVLSDEAQIIVAATAYAVTSVRLCKTKYKGSFHPRCIAAAKRVVGEFLKDRKDLFWDWCAPETVRPKKPTKSVVIRRAETAERMLAKWEKNLKLSKTKVKHWGKKVAYYRKKVAE